MAMDELGKDLLLLAAGSAGRLPVPPTSGSGWPGPSLSGSPPPAASISCEAGS